MGKGRVVQTVLSRAHSTPASKCMLAPTGIRRKPRLTSRTVQPVLDDATQRILELKEEFSRLVEVASKHPFYKYNGVWSRELQNLVSGVPREASQSGCRRILTVDGKMKGVLYRTLCLAGRSRGIQRDKLLVLDDRGGWKVP